MPEVVLVFPPTTKPSEPPVGIAMLAGWLRTQKISCEIIDARMEFLEASLDDSHRQPFLQQRTYENPDRHLGALARLNEGLRRGSPETDRLSATDHRPSDHPLFSRRDIRASVAESQVFDTAMAQLADRIVAMGPRLVGISIGYLSQLVAGLQLRQQLARRAPELPIIIGGSLVNSWQRHLSTAPLIDDERYAFGPGQHALIDVLPEVSLRADPQVATPRYAELFERHRYLAPEAIGSVSLSQGCYWGRCSFCHEADAARYRRLSTAELDQVVGGLVDQGIRFLHLTDHAVAPAHLRQLAAIARSRDVRWYGFVRLHRQLAEPSFADELARAGCQMLELGLESASPQVLSAMDKGHDPALAAQVIHSLAQAGIRVFAYVMFGFPTETDDDRERTLAFLEEHAASIHGINVSIFNLPVGSAIEREPARFGIQRLMPFRPGQELSFYRDFVAGHDRKHVRRFLQERVYRSEAVAPVLWRTPRGFKSNHAPFVPTLLARPVSRLP